VDKKKTILLKAEKLIQAYGKGRHSVEVVKGVSFDVHTGETLGVAGESGAGKSTLLRLLTAREKPLSGQVWFDGRLLNKIKDLKSYYKKIGIVFQQPRLSFDPRWDLFRSLEEPLVLNHAGSAENRRKTVVETAAKVGLDKSLLDSRPQQLSGGQLQRAAIARAIMLKPALVFLDEPTAALDVSIQAQILNLLKDLQQRDGLTYIIVSHDISVLAWLAKRMIILKEGQVVEENDVDQILNKPQAEYTQTLLNAVKM